MNNISIEYLVALALRKSVLLGAQPASISVIVPIFNHAEYLLQCLTSVVAQQTGSFELICIDDSSTDPRISEILNAIKSIPGILCLRNEFNQGISATQNRAASYAKGKYLAFVDCDDYLMPGALEYVLKVAEQNDSPDYLFTDRCNVDASGRKLFDAVYDLVRSGREIVEDLADRMIASHLKVIRRDSFEKVAGFSENYSGIQDWELALKISIFGCFYYVPKVFYCHRLHQASVTNSDNRGQAKKSNLLRRSFLEQNGKILPKGSVENQIIRKFTVGKISGLGWYCPDQITLSLGEKAQCHLDATGELTAIDIEFIVDFNSYFDRIEVDRIDVASQIVGSLWSPTMLHSPLHIIE